MKIIQAGQPYYRLVGLTLAAGALDPDLPDAIARTILFAMPLLIGQVVSLMRHSASVNLQPQVQLLAFRRCNAIFFCAAVSPAKLTPGSAFARAAFFKKIWPVSLKVSMRAVTGMPITDRTSIS